MSKNKTNNSKSVTSSTSHKGAAPAAPSISVPRVPQLAPAATKSDESKKPSASNATTKELLLSRIQNVIERTDRWHAMLAGGNNQSAADAAKAANKALTALAAEAAKLPASWKVYNRTVRVVFHEGDVVMITKDKREEYAALVEDSELEELRVVKNLGKKIVVSTESGARMFVPVGHLEASDEV